MKNTKVLNFLRVLIFNIVETIVIFMIGLIFELNYNYIISFTKFLNENR